MGGERVSLRWTKRKHTSPRGPKGPGGALKGFLKSENRPNAERVAHQRTKSSLESERHRQEPSASSPPDLSSDEILFFIVGQILSRLLIPSLDHLEEREHEKAQMGCFQNGKPASRDFVVRSRSIPATGAFTFAIGRNFESFRTDDEMIVLPIGAVSLSPMIGHRKPSRFIDGCQCQLSVYRTDRTSSAGYVCCFSIFRSCVCTVPSACSDPKEKYI